MMTSHFTHRCTITKQTKTVDNIGRPTYTAENVHENTRCRLDPVRFRSLERAEAGSAQSVLRAMIYTEYFSDMTPDMQILLNGNSYNIISINPIDGMVVGSHLEIEVNLITNG